MNEILYGVTCHTEGCQNCDILITMNALSENPYFVCGPCCNEITDVYRYSETTEETETVIEIG